MNANKFKLIITVMPACLLLASSDLHTLTNAKQNERRKRQHTVRKQYGRVGIAHRLLICTGCVVFTDTYAVQHGIVFRLDGESRCKSHSCDLPCGRHFLYPISIPSNLSFACPKESNQRKRHPNATAAHIKHERSPRRPPSIEYRCTNLPGANLNARSAARRV